MIAADAHASTDPSCQNFMENNFAESEISHLIYTYQPYKRRVITYESQISGIYMVIQDIQEGKKIGIMCRTVENCMILYKIAVSQMIKKGEIASRVIMLHSDSPDDDLEKLENIEILINVRNIHVLIFSPILTTGADISADISAVAFERVCFFAKAETSCGARPSHQGPLRFRWVVSNEFIICRDTSQNKSHTETQIVKELKAKEDVSFEYMKQIADSKMVDGYCYDNRKLCPLTKSTTLLQQYILNKKEDTANFNKTWEDIAIWQQYTIERGVDIEDEPLSDYYKKLKAEVKKEKKERKKPPLICRSKT